MKQLPPSIRDDTRYLKFKIHSDEKIEIGELLDTVWDESLGYLGSKGCSKANFWVISNLFNEEKQEGVIRVNRDMEDDLRAGLTQINEFKEKKGFIQIIETSGAVKNLKND